jgi:hypothetical protein
MVYKQLLCELFHPLLHGYIKNVSDPNVLGHYLVITSRVDELDEFLLEYRDSYEFMFQTTEPKLLTHPLIRNYPAIAARFDYIKLEIGQMIELQGGERVAILKTFWIRIIQRAWKKVFRKRQQVLLKRCMLSSIKYREICGLWPQPCNHMPGLRGILSL